MLGQYSDSDMVSHLLALKMVIDIRELESGPHCSGYIIKDGILAFLNGCLSAQSDLPNMAHLLLGFSRIGESLSISPNSQPGGGLPLLYAIVDLTQNYPDSENGTFISWLIHIKSAALQVLRQLWVSQLSSTLVMVELRKCEFLSAQFANLTPVTVDGLWDGVPISSLAFWMGTSANGLAEFLNYRAFLYEYAATELRSVSFSRLTSIQKQVLSILTGHSMNFDGLNQACVNLFDLFDFADLDFGERREMPQVKYFVTVDIETCLVRASDDSVAVYDLDAARELLQLQAAQSFGDGRTRSATEEEQLHNEAIAVINYLDEANRRNLVETAKRHAIHMWVELVIATLQYSDMDYTSKVQFSLHALQIMTPKLELMIVDEVEDALQLARLGDALISTVATRSLDAEGRYGKLLIERLYHLFRACIAGMHVLNSFPALREVLYGICSRYLGFVIGKGSGARKAQRNAMDCIRSAGVPLINVICDDAEGSVETCRLSALSLLGLFVNIARGEKSSFVVDTLVNMNMLEVLMEPLKYVADDFQRAESNGEYLLQQIKTKAD